MQIRVMADDFTSATDALPTFAQRGWATRVALHPTPPLRAFAMTLPTQAAIHPSWQLAQRPGVVVGSQNPRSREQHRHVQASGQGATLWATPEERGDPQRLTALLVEEVCEAVLAGRCDGLVVTGGETAKHIARRLQVQDIRVLHEVQPGIPLCLMHTPRGVIPLVTKAGGFGDDDVLTQCVQAMTGEP